MQQNENAPEWHMVGGNAIAIPGAYGRVERLTFDNGVAIYRSEIEAEADCSFTVTNRLPQPWIGFSVQLTGGAHFSTPIGTTGSMAENTLNLMRVGPSGFILDVRAGTLIRHTGVAISLRLLKRQLNGSQPMRLAPYMARGKSLERFESIPLPSGVKTLATSLFGPSIDGPLRTMAIEGLGMQLFSQAMIAFCEYDPDGEMFTEWELMRFDELIAHVKDNLNDGAAARNFATRAGLKIARVEQMFKVLHGVSLATFLRIERLRTARRLLLDEKCRVSELAYRLGYRHVANFSRAYRAHFGESPATTLHRPRNNCNR
ncbi:helix-turn-helix domain-containing protein [Tritonibacter mobilis]|uniref:helix-turn-helix domain-containing protein n=1 Tax=Tritonibacter mobilis TaxID=379347 RepID=UPI000806E879|nr:AraC family transcriptional regulator [Tritonibacter mobilis]NKX39661.1 helix-turn-helix transcriptional regulator [Rhodobacteraceae bacterium R_SAG5]